MSEALLGVIIGAASAILGGIIGTIINHTLDKKRRLYDKMQETYELVQQCLNKPESFFAERITDADREIIETAIAKLTLYSKEDVTESFKKIVYLRCNEKRSSNDKDVLHHRAEIKRLMRRDLGLST